MRRAQISALIIALATMGNAAAADTYTIDTVHSDVSFKIRHLVSKTAGRFADFDGTLVVDWNDLDASSVSFVIKTASIDTRNPDRDKHLCSADFFDAEIYPEITFVSHKITKATNNTYAVTGTFTMHGVSREITLPVTWLGEVRDPWGNFKGGFEASTTINRKEYGLEWNKALETGGLLLGDEVEISISLEVAKKK